MAGISLLLNETKCPVCGKCFYPTAEWAYKLNTWRLKTARYTCSWSCLQKYKRMHPRSFKWKGNDVL